MKVCFWNFLTFIHCTFKESALLLMHTNQTMEVYKGELLPQINLKIFLVVKFTLVKVSLKIFVSRNGGKNVLIYQWYDLSSINLFLRVKFTLVKVGLKIFVCENVIICQKYDLSPMSTQSRCVGHKYLELSSTHI